MSDPIRKKGGVGRRGSGEKREGGREGGREGVSEGGEAGREVGEGR